MTVVLVTSVVVSSVLLALAALWRLRGDTTTPVVVQQHSHSDSASLPLNASSLPKEGVVLMPVKSFVDKVKNGLVETKAFPSEADNVSDKYSIYVERHYTVKVPIVVDVHKPAVWVSDQKLEEKAENQK